MRQQETRHGRMSKTIRLINNHERFRSAAMASAGGLAAELARACDRHLETGEDTLAEASEYAAEIRQRIEAAKEADRDAAVATRRLATMKMQDRDRNRDGDRDGAADRDDHGNGNGQG